MQNFTGLQIRPGGTEQVQVFAVFAKHFFETSGGTTPPVSKKSDIIYTRNSEKSINLYGKPNEKRHENAIFTVVRDCAGKRIEKRRIRATVTLLFGFRFNPMFNDRKRKMSKPICREKCGACCIAPSISSPIPGMPQGKPAGVPCVNLDENMRCKLFTSPDRPAVCASLQPSWEMCGTCREEAMDFLTRLEEATAPEK